MSKCVLKEATYGILHRVYTGFCRRLLRIMDNYVDQNICGQSLEEYVPSIFRDDVNGIGSTGSQATHYLILKHIFTCVELKSSDTFLDVGCGKGRVLAFLVKEKYSCEIYGVEHNESVGIMASEWSKKYSNVHIIIKNAFSLDYNAFSVLFMCRPFLPKTFLEFIEYLEETLIHSIVLIYWVDQQSGYLLMNRLGWKMQTRKTLNRIYGIKIAESPQAYSIWNYDPKKRENKEHGPKLVL